VCHCFLLWTVRKLQAAWDYMGLESYIFVDTSMKIVVIRSKIYNELFPNGTTTPHAELMFSQRSDGSC
jgi:hypothetical protein